MMNKPEILPNCNITEESQRHIDFLSALGFDLVVMPKKDHWEYGLDLEQSYNYISEDVCWEPSDSSYRYTIPDNITDTYCIKFIKNKLETLQDYKVQLDELELKLGAK